jgi:hypothetical protein
LLVIWFCKYTCEKGYLSAGASSALLLYNMQILMNVMGCFTNITQIFKVQGAFYEIAVLLMLENTQEGYYDKKPVTKEMKDSKEG